MRDFKSKKEFEVFRGKIVKMHDEEGVSIPKIALKLGISGGKATMIYKNVDSHGNSPYNWKKSVNYDDSNRIEISTGRYSTIEDEFDQWARKEGYKVYKNGFPDRVIEKNGEYFFVEIKNRGEELRENQKVMHKILKECGIDVIVVRPNHLTFDILEKKEGKQQ